MGTFDREVGALIAMASVTGTDGTATLNRGFNAITRTGAGVYTLQYDNLGSGASPLALADNETVVKVQPKGAAARIATTQHTADTVTTVRIFDVTPTPADADFDIMIFRRAN